MTEERGETRTPRRRLRRGLIASGALLAVFLVLALVVVRPSPLPDPVALFPESGSLWILDVPTDLLPELDDSLDALIAQIPPYLSYRGGVIDIPPGTLTALRGSGPWRLAVWQSDDRSQWGILIGGEAYGFARHRWLDRLLARPIPGLDSGTYGEIGGAIVIASDRATWESLRDAPRPPTAAISSRHLAFRYGEARPLEGEIWLTFPPGEEWVTSRSEDHRWRGWLRELGVDVELTPTEESEGEQLWRAEGIRPGLRELRAHLDRF